MKKNKKKLAFFLCFIYSGFIMNETVVFRNRIITKEDIECIKRIIKTHPDKSRRFISQEVCRQWEWQQPNGFLKDMICRSLLIKLFNEGLITLPAPRIKFSNTKNTRAKIKEIHVDETPIETNLKELQPLIIKQVRRSKEENLCNYIINKYHYLGYTRPVGEHLKYLVYDKQKRLLAALIFSSAPYYIGVRDQYVGWNPKVREKNLHLITNNTRFLILNWIKVEHLASHILSLIRQRLSDNFQTIYNHKVYLVETFVDTEKYAGICYKADNWKCVGLTTGVGKLSRTKKVVLSKKAVYIYSLYKNFRGILCN